MKLDLLYEVDVPKPWGKPHPYGQREAEQARLPGGASSRSSSPTSSASTPPGTSSTTSARAARTRPSPEVIIGALSQSPRTSASGFGVTLMPHAFTPPMRVAEKVATADVLSQRPRRVGHRPVDPDGADRVRRRPSTSSRDQWQEAIAAVVQACGRRVLRVPRQVPRLPAPDGHAQAVQDPHPPCWMAATSDGSAAEAPGASGSALLSFSIMQPLEQMAEHIQQYREAAANPTPITRVTTTRSRRTRSCTAPTPSRSARRTASGTRCGGGTRTWPSSRSSGSSPTSRRRSGTRSSRC